MDYIECVRFMKKAHQGQYREQGIPYFYHPLAVAELLKEKGFGEVYQITGLFHDLLEDTSATEEDILNMSCKEVLEAVKVLTKRRNLSMEDYMDGIAKNPIAKVVKLADRYHNLVTLRACSKEKIQRKLDETDSYFLELAKGTPFEEDLLDAATLSQRFSNELNHIDVYRRKK